MTHDSMFKTGDLIVGSSDPRKSVYSETGAKLSSNGVKIYGAQEDIEAQQEEIISYVSRSGGKRMTSTSSLEKSQMKRKRGRPPQAKQQVIQEQPQNNFMVEYKEKPSEPVMQTIQFENDFGKIKSKIESYDEQDMAIMLVFPDEDSVLFEPRVGEALKLYLPHQSAQDVYYPGVTFNSPDTSKKLMILFKIPVE